MNYFLLLSIFIALVCSAIFLFIYLRHLQLRKSIYLYNEALTFYKSKNLNKTIFSLKKSFIIPFKGVITRKEALLNIQVLELLDLVLLNKNIDSENLTRDFKKILSAVRGTVKLDESCFYSISMFYSNYLKDCSITQQQIEAIALCDLSFKKGTESNHLFTFQNAK